MFEIIGIPSEMVITSDNASYFCSLMREFTKRLGISPRLSRPNHPEGHAMVERAIQNVQRSVAKLACEHRNNWAAYLGAALWCLREARNETSGISPHLHVFGFLPQGPLAILRESWLGERVLPSLNVSAEKYLEDL
jgi:transposase InsO family protein